MKRIKKFLVTLVITALATNFLVGIGNVGQAFDWDSGAAWGNAIGGLFSGGGDGSLSFTNYEGGLATLDAEGYDSALTASSDLKGFVLKVVNFALGFLGLIAVLMIIYAGVTYVTSAGQDEKTGNAKKTITYAAVGLLIVLGSFAFVNTVIKAALVGEGGEGTQGQFGQNYGTGFNAMAEEVKGIAVDIYTGYVLLANQTESFKNILSDSQKTSLDLSTLPQRSTILAFLQDTKTKLLEIKTRTGALTGVGAAINDKVREIELEIDKIGNITMGGGQGQSYEEGHDQEKAYVKYSNGKLSYFKTTDGEEFWNALGTSSGIIDGSVPESKGYTYVDGGYDMLMEWKNYKETLSFDEIVPLLGKNYQKQLEKNLDRLKQIYDLVSNISAIGKDGSTKAGKAYTDMLVTTAGSPYGGLYGSLYAAVSEKSWRLDTLDIDTTAESSLLPGLEAHSIYYTELLNLKFVNARLHADTVSGNAPLTVILDVGASTDPAGGSIDDGNVVWDPAGTQTVNGVLSGLPQMKDGTMDPNSYVKEKGAPDGTISDLNVILPLNASVKCDIAANTSKELKIALTSRRCEFTEPGTYLAMVVVNSNDPSKYGPGVSILKIVANPPTTEIDLQASSPLQPESYIIHYVDSSSSTSDPIGSVNKSQHVVVESDVKDLVLDASGTKAESFKWTFGNGKQTDWATNLNRVTSKEFGEYPIGSYPVKLEVMNKSGVIDSKTFNLVVKNVAANLSAEGAEAEVDIKGDNTVTVNSLVTFDGSSSVASRGNKVTNYKWDIYKIDDKSSVGKGTPINENNGNQGPDKSKYQYTFKTTGWYEIRLTVNGAGKGPSDTDDANPGMKIKVVSKPPVAAFDYEVLDPTLPGTLVFNNESLDPDNNLEQLQYTWTITPEQKAIEGNTSVMNWTMVKGTLTGKEIKDANPTIKFNEKGPYKVKLKVNVDPTLVAEEESAEIEKEIEITKTIDVSWDKTQQKTAGKMSTTAKPEDFLFFLKSDNAVGYEIKFGDGETASDAKFPAEGIKHQYKQVGRYIAEVTVFDADDDDNIIKKRVLIGGENAPVAYANILVNDAEIIDDTIPVEVTRMDKLFFSGAKSVNSDGTGRKLKYSWDFGDMEKSSLKEAKHSYSELSPKSGFYEAKLSVYDEADVKKTNNDSVQINICPAPPKYTTIEAIPLVAGVAPTTPVVVNTKAYGVVDPDNGKIVKYRWWYFDVNDPEEERGMVVTNNAAAQLTIGAFGDSGAQKEYGIGLEITDNDGLIYCNTETCKEAMVASYNQYPTCQKLKALASKEVSNMYPIVKATNEKNDLPVAKFSVKPPKGFTGDEFTFTSSSTDKDGKVMKYQWDFEGDGFANNAPVEGASITHKYTAKNMEGYDVKLKVIDDKGGENVSEATKVYVDALGQVPIAAFKSEVVPGTNGQTIKFVDQSKADTGAGTKIIKYSWDFDLNTDSDGDGNKTNDVDDNVASPQHHYKEMGEYDVKLIVTDDQGNKDDVTNKVKVPLASPPKVSFECTLSNAVATCTDKSVADSEAEIESRIWDFDTTSMAETADKNKDGDKTNDEDSTDKVATYTYAASGNYKIKLTVKDNQGNIVELSKDVAVNIAGGTTTGTGTTATGTTPNGLGFGIETGKDPVTNPVGTQPVIKVEKMVPSLTIKIIEADGITITTPIPDKEGIIYLIEGQRISIYFAGTGPIAYYTIDLNVNYDSNGNGVSNDDWDFREKIPMTWNPVLNRIWGDVFVIKLTVEDINGNKEFTTKTIKFK